jgi:hypothetical protein
MLQRSIRSPNRINVIPGLSRDPYWTLAQEHLRIPGQARDDIIKRVADKKGYGTGDSV